MLSRNEKSPPQGLAVARFDVCNGDADGLCAVRQWRLHDPSAAHLITGLKRDIALLQHVPCEASSQVLVCDLSMQRNRAALDRLLDGGAQVRWFDHHWSGPVPAHERLDAHLDFSSEVCTSLLVDRYLGGRYRAWALVGAYGDELTTVADRLGAASGLDPLHRAVLRRLGLAINYNAYGEDASDVCIAPAELYERLARHASPWNLLRDEPVIHDIEACRRRDFRVAMGIKPHWESAQARVVVLPAAPWSRRVSGFLANALAAVHPEQAQAVLTERRDGHYAVSVRAPRASPQGAHTLCQAFGGSGRTAAAGIDALPCTSLEPFVRALSQTRWGAPC
ncbi:hypothetical protein [Hydrogenophaga sp. Root209]|uniref:hypothetical protein n=1 Tax=Hydrogenophaga sp. Root209 TaxID=1736490 RepID=UPI001F344739|nr:hypothetical protein [Hydrogenophaga sp. Root209]